MQFPKETLKLAERVAGEFRQEVGNDKRGLAKKLYQSADMFGYGYSEAILSGLWLRYPHEVKNKLRECIEAGIHTFCIAKACDLEPRLFRIEGLEEFNGNTGHITVDVDVGNKKRVIVDPLQKIFGPIEYSENSLRVRDNKVTSRARIGYKKIEEVKEEDFLHEIEYLRSTEGIIELLKAGQKVDTSIISSDFVLYNEENKELEFQIRYTPPFLHNHFITKIYKLNEKGDIISKRLDAGLFSNCGWDVLYGKDTLLTLPFESYEDLADRDKFKFRKSLFLNRTVSLDESTILVLVRSVLYSMLHAKKGLLFTDEERDELVKPFREEKERLLHKKRQSAQSKERLYSLNRLLGMLNLFKDKTKKYYDMTLDEAYFNRTTKKRAQKKGVPELDLAHEELMSLLGKDRDLACHFAYWVYCEQLLTIRETLCGSPDTLGKKLQIESLVVEQVQRYLKS